MRKEYDAIIVGGGYFGCAIAYYLAKAGFSTLLLEKTEISGGASGANFGNVQVQDASMGLSLELSLRGIEMVSHMEKELGVSIGYRPQPSIVAAEKESHLAELEKLYKEKKDAGLSIKWLNEKEVHDLEPNLARGAVVAATYYDQGIVYPFHYMYALVGKGKEYGLEIREFTQVARLLTEGGRCTGVVLSTGETVYSTHVVLTAGGGARPLCLQVGLDVPVYTVKAEAMVTEPLKPFMRTYYSSAAFFAEAHSQEDTVTTLCIGQSLYGNMLIAETCKPLDTMDKDRENLTSFEHCRNLWDKLNTFFPALKEIQVLRSWSTHSPYTDSLLPVLGKSAIPGLLLASGFKSAVVMSAITGEIIRDLVAKDHCRYDLSEFMSQVVPCEPVVV